jgi:hypothetical protein
MVGLDSFVGVGIVEQHKKQTTTEQTFWHGKFFFLFTLRILLSLNGIKMDDQTLMACSLVPLSSTSLSRYFTVHPLKGRCSSVKFLSLINVENARSTFMLNEVKVFHLPNEWRLLVAL